MKQGNLNIFSPSIVHCYKIGKIVFIYIAGSVSALSTTTTDTIILGLPTALDYCNFIIETSTGNHLPLAVVSSSIYRSSSNPVIDGWYTGFATYITTD